MAHSEAFVSLVPSHDLNGSGSSEIAGSDPGAGRDGGSEPQAAAPAFGETRWTRTAAATSTANVRGRIAETFHGPVA